MGEAKDTIYRPLAYLSNPKYEREEKGPSSAAEHDAMPHLERIARRSLVVRLADPFC